MEGLVLPLWVRVTFRILLPDLFGLKVDSRGTGDESREFDLRNPFFPKRELRAGEVASSSMISVANSARTGSSERQAVAGSAKIPMVSLVYL